ncbi:hypothetical protein IU444_28950 [Nocardia farcinica]|uniref:hypothetical protein n=1 Tax=Nocardia farcinica TaxID=37329 RepID=UPI001894A86C|nr:hypothetical protein [Nocardia farcinica]MBF6388160.1 hypothetical protein [Nocardia farcinica]
MLDDHLDMTLDPAEEERNAQIDALRDQLADHLTRLDHHAVAALSTLARLRADDVYDIEYVEGTGAAAFVHHLQSLQHTIAAVRALNPDNS